MQFAERMEGTWQPVGGGEERRVAFSLEVERADGDTYEAAGTIEVEGLASGAEVSGTMTLRPLRGRLIRYDLAFDGDDGEPYRLVGQKDLRARRPIASLTTLPAHIVGDDGHPVGTCTLRFSLRRQLVPFLASWRLARA